MIIFLIVYIIGIIATLWAYYYSLKSGEEVELFQLTFFIFSSLFSWITFVIVIIAIYGDEIVFTKK